MGVGVEVIDVEFVAMRVAVEVDCGKERVGVKVAVGAARIDNDGWEVPLLVHVSDTNEPDCERLLMLVCVRVLGPIRVSVPLIVEEIMESGVIVAKCECVLVVETGRESLDSKLAELLNDGLDSFLEFVAMRVAVEVDCGKERVGVKVAVGAARIDNDGWEVPLVRDSVVELDPEPMQQRVGV